MSKSIRISDELAALAEKEAKVFHRSPPQQVEHWAQIGRAMETALSYPAVRSASSWGREADIDALVLKSQSVEGQERLRAAIDAGSGGQYWEAAANGSGEVVRRAGRRP